jgi:hypothetical protein
MRKIGNEILVFEHLRPDRNARLDRLAVGAVLACAATVAALLGGDPLAPLERRQIAQRLVCDEDDVTALAAVAAVGPTLRDELLAAKRQAAVATAAAFDVNRGSVGERGA